jgi:hypothetical protein
MRPRVGIVDLVARRPMRALYARAMNANFASIMPQVIGVWAEELGCEVRYLVYTGVEDLRATLPRDVDVLFVSAFTPAAYLAYAISHLYRRRGVVTVLGGPHARAYADDATEHFDYVCGLTDRPLVQDLLRNPRPNPRAGVRLAARRQPATLPGVRERWRFVCHALDKARALAAVPMIGSFGCPYTCEFCIDATVPYQPLPYEQMREDLRFLRRTLPRPVVGWHDPNFGVRFDAYMGVIEDAVPPGSIRFVAESSLSLLSEPHLRTLRRHRFEGLTLGIESWFAFNGKARQGDRVGHDKVRSVAAHVDLVTRYVPYVQANFVWGLDQDAGPAPFELTKRFIDLAPAAFPSHSLYTAYGDSAPQSRALALEGRVLEVPFHCQDTSSIHNVRLRHYGAADFYALMADVVRHSYARGAAFARFAASAHSLASPGRWMGLVRSLTEAWRIGHFARLATRFAREVEFQAFAAGDGAPAPASLRDRVRADLGAFYEELPPILRAELEAPASDRPALIERASHVG